MLGRLEQSAAPMSCRTDPGVNLTDFSDCLKILDYRFDDPILPLRVDLVPHARHRPGTLRLPGDLPCFPNGFRERLFAVDVETGPKRGLRDQRMLMIRHANTDRIDLSGEILKELPKVGVPGQFRPLFVNVSKVPLIDIAEGDRFNIGMRSDPGDIRQPLMFATNAGESKFLCSHA